MHEMSLMKDIVAKLDELSEQYKDREIKAISIKLGALSHISPEHFREHFDHACMDKPYKAADLKIEACSDESDPLAQEIVLENIEIAN